MTLHRIMLADADPEVRHAGDLALQREPGLEVSLAASGADALTRLADAQALPDALLVDMALPERGGPALVAALAADDRLARIPVIYLSGPGADGDGPGGAADFAALGGRGVIMKPFDPATLPGLVREILEGQGD